MKVYIKTSAYVVNQIVKSMPTEIEFRLTDRLKKKLIQSPLVRYNQIDYICRRKHIDNLILQVNKPRMVLILPVEDYFVRCVVDPRVEKFCSPTIVFKVQ